MNRNHFLPTKEIEALPTIISTFSPCPFCGEIPNVFQITDARYHNTLSWVVECRDMGCIFNRSMPDQSLKNLREHWNARQ